MAEEEYELVPINPMKKLEKKVQELEGRSTRDIPYKELGDNIEKLNEQVSKLVTVNINLQSKITELLIKDTEMIEEVTEMIELLKRASQVETTGGNEVKIDMTPVVNELRTISMQNEEIKKGFSELSTFMRADYRRSMLQQAVSKQ